MVKQPSRIGKHVRRVRWSILVAFIAVVVVASAGLESVHLENQRTRDLAVRAVRRAAFNANQAKATVAENAKFRALRSAQLAASHQADVAACMRLHRVVRVVEGIIQSEIDAPPLVIPGLSLAQRAALAGITVRTVVQSKASLAALHKADCLSVDAIPKTVKKK